MAYINSLAHAAELNIPTRSFLFFDSRNAIKAEALWFFRIFLTFKIALPQAFPDGNYSHVNFLSFAVLAMVGAVAFKETRFYGIFGIFGLAFLECLNAWPFTINHVVLELVILLLMALMPDDETNALACSNMIIFLMLSVWFFSGLQKIVQGYYLNGEFFALEVLFREPGLGEHAYRFINSIGSWFGLEKIEFFECCKEGSLKLSYVHVFFLLILSWTTVIAELGLPLMVVFSRYKNYAIAGLFVVQFVIAYFSGEIDFAFTAFAILLLFLPKIAPFSYTTLGILLLWGQPWL